MNEEQLRTQLEKVYASTSWKITAPLRIFSKLFRKIKIWVFTPKLELKKKPIESEVQISLSMDTIEVEIIQEKKSLTPNALNYLNEIIWLQSKK